MSKPNSGPRSATVTFRRPLTAKEVLAKSQVRQQQNAQNSWRMQEVLPTTYIGEVDSRTSMGKLYLSWYRGHRTIEMVFEDEFSTRRVANLVKTGHVIHSFVALSFKKNTCLAVDVCNDRLTQETIEGRLKGRNIKYTSATTSEPIMDDEQLEINNTYRLGSYLEESLQGFDFKLAIPSPKLVRSVANVQFPDRQTWTHALENLSQSEIGKALKLEVWLANEYEVPISIYKELSHTFSSLHRQCCEEPRVRDRTWSHDHLYRPGVVVVKVYAKTIKELRRMKIVFDMLFESSTLAMLPGKSFDAQRFGNKPYILADSSMRGFGFDEVSLPCIMVTTVKNGIIVPTLYGGSPQDRLMRLQELKNEYMETHLLALEVDEKLRKRKAGLVKHLSKEFGDKIYPLQDAHCDEILIQGTAENLETITKSYKRYMTPSETADSDSCCICYNPPLDLIFTSCGHFYCQECFADLCRLTPVPMACGAL